MEDIKKRYDELIKLINKYNYYYYTLDKPLVDDATYDELMNELVTIEKSYPEIIRDDSPAKKVGAVIQTSFEQVRHDPPMLSLPTPWTKGTSMIFMNAVVNCWGHLLLNIVPS